ncbi:MAG TPA: HPr family phosphocarrier protein [Acidimicrobiia bacterium]|nr:HPr family phosphocarrier protein [Acidimicrobiia bacterium]
MGANTTPPVLARDAIFLGCPPASKGEAIDFVGRELVRRGIVRPGYVEAMQAREQTVSTYLGNGVALPHGTFESKDEINGTAIIVAQFPDGIDWGGERAHLVIGLAAVGDEHVQVLSHIADVLQDEELCQKLWTTGDAEMMYETLVARSSQDGDGTAGEVVVQVVILNPAGLHARPAALIVEKAKTFPAEVKIVKNGKPANAKSVMSLLALGARTGDSVSVIAAGPDAQTVVSEIVEIMVSTEAGP